MDLGRSYAGLLPWVEGMYRMGYLSQKEYEVNAKRYSEPLEKDAECNLLEVKRERELLQRKDKIFKGMIEQFNLHADKPRWRLKVGEDAERFKDSLASARTLLSLIKSKVSS
jgi:hypothetical protein